MVSYLFFYFLPETSSTLQGNGDNARHRVWIDEGENLTLNCIIRSDYTGDYTVEDIRLLKHDMETYEQGLTHDHVLSNTTAAFHISNITEIEWRGSVSCIFPHCEDSCLRLPHLRLYVLSEYICLYVCVYFYSDQHKGHIQQMIFQILKR